MCHHVAKSVVTRRVYRHVAWRVAACQECRRVARGVATSPGVSSRHRECRQERRPVNKSVAASPGVSQHSQECRRVARSVATSSRVSPRHRECRRVAKSVTASFNVQRVAASPWMWSCAHEGRRVALGVVVSPDGRPECHRVAKDVAASPRMSPHRHGCRCCAVYGMVGYRIACCWSPPVSLSPVLRLLPERRPSWYITCCRNVTCLGTSPGIRMECRCIAGSHARSVVVSSTIAVTSSF